MTAHLLCILLTIVALIGAVWLHWKNKAEQSGVYDPIYDGKDDY